MEKTRAQIIGELKASCMDFNEKLPLQELKDLLAGQDSQEMPEAPLQPAVNTKSDDDSKETVVVDKIQLKNIMDRLAELEGKKTKKRVELLNKTCRLRLLDGKIVVGYGKSYEKKDIGGNRVLMIEVITEDKKKTEVEFVNFNETGEQLLCEIIDTEKKEVEEELGFVYAKKVDYDNYRTYETDKEVPLINKSLVIKYKLKLPDGREVWMDEEAIN